MAAVSEAFSLGDSLVHRADPRVRIVCALLLSIPVAVFQSFFPACLAVAVGLVLVILARLPLVQVGKRLVVVNVFILFLWLFLPFSTPGQPLLSLGSLHMTTEGIRLALLITAKSNAIVLMLLALLGTIPVQSLGPALQHLKVPAKLCHILLFTYRYIFVIHDEYQTMRQAMASRGFSPKTDTRTYRAYAWLVGMLLIKSWDRAERVFGAMQCRGFNGRFYSLTRFSTTLNDYVFLIWCAALTTSLCIMEWGFRGVL